MVIKKQNDIFEKIGEVVETQEKQKRYSIDQAIADMVGVFCDPIICYPSPWMDTLPDTLKSQITMDRLFEQLKASRGETPTASDSEALAYLYPASLEAHLGHLWSNIYIYLATRVVAAQGREVPKDLVMERPLDSQEEYELRRLKSWIYEKRCQHRKEKATDIRKERLAKEKQEEQEKAAEVEQHAFDLFD